MKAAKTRERARGGNGEASKRKWGEVSDGDDVIATSKKQGYARSGRSASRK